MEYSVEAPVTDATVYPDRARVICRGNCELDEGSHTIVFEDLPLALDPDSVRAQGSGTAQVRLRSVDVHRRHYVITPSSRVRELETTLEERVDALQSVSDARVGAEAALAHLDGMRSETEQYARGLARGQSTVEDQAKLLTYIQDQDQEIRGKLRELNSEARDIKREIDKLSAELDQIRSARPLQRYEVRLDVDVTKSGEFDPEISYVVNQAGWQPLYDMRFWQPDNGKTVDATLDVTYLAEITQNTGQPWDSVRLVLSTARPALNQRMPELRPWFIDEFQPPPPRPQARQALMSKSPGPEMAMAAAPERHVAEVAIAEPSRDAAAVTFAVGGGVDIPSDGTPQKTVIGQFGLEPTIDYFCAPRNTDAVFRRATLTNTGPGPLLRGRVNLFAGDEFIGSNRLDYVPLNAEFELLLGAEERIEVERKLVRRDVDKRLLRDMRQIVYGYEIAVRNGLKTSVLVVVQDQYPNSRHEQIKVKLESTSPAPASQTELHIIEWQIEIQQESEQKIQYSYAVEHPRDMNVNGLVD